jgi:hypothetical protein
MLVTLGSNQDISANSSQTFQYACSSFQKLYLHTKDATGDHDDAFCTVSIGNQVICNDVPFEALGLIGIVNGGGIVQSGGGVGVMTFSVDFGSHILEPLENLYVTIRNSGSGTVEAVDVSAEVNQGGVYEPLKYTNYSDSVFTDSNTLAVYAWANTSLESDATTVTIRNQSYSSTPSISSGNNVAKAQCQGYQEYNRLNMIAIMAKNQVPQDTSINYNSTDVDGIVCVSGMEKSAKKASASGQMGRAVLASMTSSERKAI